MKFLQKKKRDTTWSAIYCIKQDIPEFGTVFTETGATYDENT